MTFVKPNRTSKANDTDDVTTPEDLAIWILKYVKPTGLKLDPAKGSGNFYRNMKGKKDWCEIKENRDFFDYKKKVDYIITNPPYSIYDNFLLKSFEVSDNVVLLVPLGKTFKSKKIDLEIQKYGGLKEVVMLGGGGNCGFTFGFPTGLLWYKRGFKGKVKITRKYDWKK